MSGCLDSYRQCYRYLGSSSTAQLIDFGPTFVVLTCNFFKHYTRKMRIPLLDYSRRQKVFNFLRLPKLRFRIYKAPIGATVSSYRCLISDIVGVVLPRPGADNDVNMSLHGMWLDRNNRFRGSVYVFARQSLGW